MTKLKRYKVNITELSGKKSITFKDDQGRITFAKIVSREKRGMKP